MRFLDKILWALWFVSVIIFVGSTGNIELSDGVPFASLCLGIVSFSYMIGFVFLRGREFDWTENDYNLMQIDLDDWCFRRRKDG